MLATSSSYWPLPPPPLPARPIMDMGVDGYESRLDEDEDDECDDLAEWSVGVKVGAESDMSEPEDVEPVRGRSRIDGGVLRRMR